MNVIDSAFEPIRVEIEKYDVYIQNVFNNDKVKAHIFISLFILFGSYWIIGGILTIIDILERPRFILRYKIQKNKSQVNKKNLIKLIRQVLINQLISAVFGYSLILMQQNNLIPAFKDRFPTITRFLYEWITFVLIREVLFYYSHRMLHHGSFYKYIHKQHHEWQTPVAISAVYCHPLEHIISNIIPVLIGPYLMSSHSLVTHLWILYTLILTLNDHCGYHFPLVFSPRFHDFHHLKFNVNYGILGILDRLHGTDKLFRKSKYFQNHRIYWSLSPPNYKID